MQRFAFRAANGNLQARPRQSDRARFARNRFGRFLGGDKAECFRRAIAIEDGHAPEIVRASDQAGRDEGAAAADEAQRPLGKCRIVSRRFQDRLQHGRAQPRPGGAQSSDRLRAPHNLGHARDDGAAARDERFRHPRQPQHEIRRSGAQPAIRGESRLARTRAAHVKQQVAMRRRDASRLVGGARGEQDQRQIVRFWKRPAWEGCRTGAIACPRGIELQHWHTGVHGQRTKDRVGLGGHDDARRERRQHWLGLAARLGRVDRDGDRDPARPQPRDGRSNAIGQRQHDPISAPDAERLEPPSKRLDPPLQTPGTRPCSRLCRAAPARPGSAPPTRRSPHGRWPRVEWPASCHLARSRQEPRASSQ